MVVDLYGPLFVRVDKDMTAIKFHSSSEFRIFFLRDDDGYLKLECILIFHGYSRGCVGDLFFCCKNLYEDKVFDLKNIHI